jgi:transcriptional regulator with XRE-family HTH domain
MGNAAKETGLQTIELTDDRSGRSPRAITQAQALGNEPARPDSRPVEPAPLGPLLADVRTARGLSARALAAAIGAAPSTVTRIERSERRVSPAMLASLAAALAPDDPGPLTASLTAAAGHLLVADTPGGARRRGRRMRRAERERNRRLVAQMRARQAMQRQAADTAAAAYRLFDRTGALDDVASLDRIGALLDESQRMRDEAEHEQGADYDRQIVATAKAFGLAASHAAGNAPKKRRPRRPSLAEPARAGTASEQEVLAYIRQMSRDELGVEYD